MTDVEWKYLLDTPVPRVFKLRESATSDVALVKAFTSNSSCLGVNSQLL